ncbi:vitronectin a [Heptranchias perlo]|uniref:vitronectin a n=1 Tax=Heptranchias perlo TaxID=212740 RepID=UPI00355A1BA2
MRPLIILLVCSFLSSVAADRGSCVGRCELGFNSSQKCQCDSLCRFYKSCCEDYETVCKRARGDMFLQPDDEYDDLTDLPTDDFDLGPQLSVTVEPDPELAPVTEQEPNPELGPELELEPGPEPDPEQEPGPSLEPELELEPEPEQEPDPELDPDTEQEPNPELGPELEPEPEPEPDPEQEPESDPESETTNLCFSKRSFDAFTDFKNGSIFAFQGKYFYELDKHSIVPGYPKLIEDVWGMRGPIDAAFTRVNCEGKTYIFKGDAYWRFDNGIMEDDFPRTITTGFPGIPTGIDAALAVPASNIDGKERVYFFKGSSYWQYVFQNQPSQQDCTHSPISATFQRYTHIMEDSWEDFFMGLFGALPPVQTSGPHSISQDWCGIPGRVDSAMIGKLFLFRQNREKKRRRGNQRRGRNRYKGQWWQDSSSMEKDMFSLFPLFPSQSVYFFVKDKYYRVDLETKQVAHARPAYPRSIARYWFKCKAMEMLHE